MIEEPNELKDRSQLARVSWRSVAIPAEHGGWGMLLSPILLGLLVVPSFVGIFLALANIVAFLARTPLKIVWKDTQRGRRYARTATAIKALGIYILLLTALLSWAFANGGIIPLLPMIFALPLAAVILYNDLLSTKRSLLPELAAPVALSAVVAGMALADGWDWPHALALWSIPLMRELPAILFVRARLRLDRGHPAGVNSTIFIHLIAALLALALVGQGLIPGLAAVAIFALLGRAVYGLSKYRRPMAVKALGWSEIIFSLMTVILSAIGYWVM